MYLVVFTTDYWFRLKSVGNPVKADSSEKQVVTDMLYGKTSNEQANGCLRENRKDFSSIVSYCVMDSSHIIGIMSVYNCYNRTWDDIDAVSHL